MRYYVLTARGNTNGPTNDYGLYALDELFKSPVEAFPDDVDPHEVTHILCDKHKESIDQLFDPKISVEEIDRTEQ